MTPTEERHEKLFALQDEINKNVLESLTLQDEITEGQLKAMREALDQLKISVIVVAIIEVLIALTVAPMLILR